MTTLVIAQKKIKLLFPFPQMAIFEDRFGKVNTRGTVTFILALLAGILMMVYFMCVYFTFELGFKIRENNKVLAGLENSVLDSELKLQGIITSIGKEKEALGESMEEISTIYYLTPQEASVFYSYK